MTGAEAAAYSRTPRATSQRAYRYLTGETRKVTVDLTAIAAIWQHGSPEVRDVLTTQIGRERLWAALEIADNGYLHHPGSGGAFPIKLPGKSGGQ